MINNAIDLSGIDWHETLPRYGIPPESLSNRPGPCPICCAGKDRFRFDNLDGRGTFICSKCGAGTGVEFIHKMTGIPYAKIYAGLSDRHVHAHATHSRPGDASLKPKGQLDESVIRERLRNIWEASSALDGSDPASLYLTSRVHGLDLSMLLKNTFRWHRGLDYYGLDDSGTVVKQGTYPALISRVFNASGKPISIHRTYLTEDGFKASVPKPKKLMSGLSKLNGAAIRLNCERESPILAVCEGIETGLAVLASQIAAGRRINVWALVNCGNLAKADIPPWFRKVVIYADNDPVDPSTGFSPGIHYAEQLLDRLQKRGTRAAMYYPNEAGLDWADVWERLNLKFH